jgi:hypothetical protein
VTESTKVAETVESTGIVEAFRGIAKGNIRELTADELDTVTGGAPRLIEAACKGKVISKVDIHGDISDPPVINGSPYGWSEM